MAAGGHGAFAPRPCRAKIAAILKSSEAKEKSRNKPPQQKTNSASRFPMESKEKPTNQKPCPKCQPPPADFGHLIV
jgi:hypothetical protein